MITVDYKSGNPLHEQITQKIKTLILSGSIKKDEKLPSVRELSVSLTVNPNTVQRAYKNLEAEGYLYSVLGKGNYASVPQSFDPVRKQKLRDEVSRELRELICMNETKESIYSLVDKIFDERNDIK